MQASPSRGNESTTVDIRPGASSRHTTGGSKHGRANHCSFGWNALCGMGAGWGILSSLSSLGSLGSLGRLLTRSMDVSSSDVHNADHSGTADVIMAHLSWQ